MAAAYGHTKAGVVPLDAADARPAARGAGDPRARRGAARVLRRAADGLPLGPARLRLSYANRRRLEIARATATNPRLLLLDEPAAGMNPKETQEITELIGQAPHRGRLHDPRDRARHARRRRDLGPRRSRSTTASRSPRARSRRSRPTRGSSRRTSAPEGWRRSERPATNERRRRSSSSRGSTPTTGRSTSSRTRTSSSARASSSACSAATRPGKSTTLKTILGLVRPRTGTRHVRRRGRDAAADGPPDQPRARDRAREPAAVRADDRAREPRDGRLPPATRRPQGGVRARLLAVPARSTSGARSSPGRSRAASSRWSRWAAR